MIFELIKSFILGIVQGITEWLPVSSTGHMLLVDEFLKLDFPKDFTDMFFVVIQFGSILAVLVLYLFYHVSCFLSNRRFVRYHTQTPPGAVLAWILASGTDCSSSARICSNCVRSACV